jgi:hypothetical protein
LNYDHYFPSYHHSIMLGQQSFPSYIQFPTIGPRIPPKLIPLAVLTSTPHPVGPGTPTMPILKGKKKPIYLPSTPGGAQTNNISCTWNQFEYISGSIYSSILV